MVGWTIVMAGIMLIDIVVVFNWQQRPAGHIVYWQQQRAVEEKGEAASQLPDAQERRQKNGPCQGERGTHRWRAVAPHRGEGDS